MTIDYRYYEKFTALRKGMLERVQALETEVVSLRKEIVEINTLIDSIEEDERRYDEEERREWEERMEWERLNQ